jgi:hypothetical protein
MLEWLDQFVREIGINPYFITLGVLASLAPLTIKIWRLSSQGLSVIRETFRTGVRRSKFRRMRTVFRNNFFIGSSGVLKRIEKSNDDLSYEIRKRWYNFFDFISRTSAIYFLLSINEVSIKVELASLFIVVSAFVSSLELSRGFKDDILRIRFQVKAIKKKTIFLAQRKDGFKDQLAHLEEEEQE